MDLFEPLQATITLPAKFVTPIKVGRHSVNRLHVRSSTISIDVQQSEHTGYFKLTCMPGAPFEVLYLKNPHIRGRCPEGVPVLKGKQPFTIEELTDKTPLVWEHLPEPNQSPSPDDIRQSWRGQFQFREEDNERDEKGLRRPQLGALHALSAWSATDKELAPATVVLPTGTGKTETMLATLVYQRCEKVLVIVPSDSLRTQTANKFFSLGYLPELGVVPGNIQLPAIAVLRTGLRSLEDADNLAANANVIIATTSVLSPSASLPEAIDRLCSHCSHLFVDEAHHISAKSWLTVRERFTGKKVIQFTATPFRNDKKPLGGRIIYNYTMGEAQRAGYFTQVRLIPVEEYFSTYADRTIAQTAISRLREDLKKGFDHLMMARTSSKARAESLKALYDHLAPDLNPIVVHSDYGKTEVKSRLEQLKSHQSKIVICVDMLGEGYDLPNLKVAALHNHHKSLAVALQFIGRFTRSSHNQNIGPASVIMNVADPAVEGNLQNLYALGADWDSVLRRLSEARIEREVKLQEVVDSLKQKGNLHNQLSLWNLEPSYTTMLFQTSCEQWQPERFTEHLPKFEEHWHALSEEKKLLVVLGIQATPVKWGSFKELKDTNYKLLIVHWDQTRKALFIFSNDYKIFRPMKLAESLCDNQCQLLCGDQIFNVFNGIEYPLARNLGASQLGSISFTQYFGPNVTEGLSLIEASQSSLSNIAALGYESGNKVIWGCSQRKGKVWSPQKGGSIADWCDWVKIAWDKVVDGQTDAQNITRHFLRPKKMEAPHSGHPLSAQWGEQLLAAFEDRVEFFFGDHSVPFYRVDLTTDGTETDGSVRIILACEAKRSIYKLVIDKQVNAKGYDYQLIEGDEITIQKGNADPEPLPDFMVSDPVMIYYTDSAFSYNDRIVHVGENAGIYPAESIVSMDWTGTDIRKESMGKQRDQASIQWRYFDHIQNDYDVVINDDGSGESADIVALKVIDGKILLTLVHAKYSSADNPGARLKDLYEVCGQTQRCVRWKHLNLNYLYQHIKRREELWQPHSRFLKGTIQELAAIRDRARTTPIKFHVVIVQPGLSRAQINEEGLKLLGSSALFIKKTTMAELEVVGSE